ncbi:hypothetical protein EV191_104149 [Tamaricihabitans halophyticus]|uniref:YbaB/EbfC DNA-binding family protein n=1 Tax=Tamaricihabitans halophyticus TaxID=1262583 RepID=A0A4R2QUC5_9PSEU|nr:YbaB/EbfC family nucleoid-associated protein [Tamaricihabitans halophyticus]TCP53582.1 hypothetical protein EV191_104149 [Tamaricihabitans halophyticus]
MASPHHDPLAELNNLPSTATFMEIMDGLRQSLQNIPDAQQELLELTGEATSDDGLLTVVVGPRGQLVDVQIDPRLFRTPDAVSLRSLLLEVNAAAIASLTDQVNNAMADQIPPEIDELRAQYQIPTSSSYESMFKSDAEIVAERGKIDE